MNRMTTFVLFSLVSAAALMAQVSTGEIAGAVTDASGAAVPNAKISAINLETNIVARETSSASDGNYVMTLLPPATYSISVEAGGFRKLVQSGVLLQTNQRARIDLQLQVGQVSETVEVVAAAPLLESTSSALGAVINQQLVGELPLNGRNFVQLAILSPGVNGAGFSTGGTIQSGSRPDDRRPGTEIFSNGNREGSNNFLFDGADNNERLIQLIVLRPAVESIREFKVQTNMYSADLGRNSGAVVDVVTKSGTNALHGSAFEFLRNSAMDARNFFNTRGTAFPSFRYNQYGGSLGGPVIKNKTFWFADYEGYRRTLQNFSTFTIPTAAIRRGDFSGENRIYDPLSGRQEGAQFVRDQFPGNQIPASRWDPVTRKLMAGYPATTNGNIANNYQTNLGQIQNWDQGDIRIDHQISSNDNIFGRWSSQKTDTIAPYTFPKVKLEGLPKEVGVGNEDTFAGPASNPVQHAVVSYTKVISARMVNDARIGFNRFVLNYTQADAAPGDNLGNLLGIRNANSHPLQYALPIINNNNYAGAGHSRSLPIYRRSNTFHYQDNVTYTAGAHTLKFGAAIYRRQITEYQTNRGNGRFNFNGAFTDSRGAVPGASGNAMASFILGYATLTEQDYTLAWTGQRLIESGLYVADDWRVSKKLTLNLGLRHDYFSPVTEVADRLANFDPDTATIKVANRDGVDRRMGVRRNFRDFAPRLGFAYKAMAHTVIRGGYGLFFNPSGNGGAALRLFRHVPFGPILSLVPGDFNVGTRVSDGFPAPPDVNFASINNPTGGVIGLAKDYRSSYAQQFNLTVEHEFAPMQLLVKAAYVGNLGRRLHTTIDLNQPLAGAGPVANRRAFFSVRPGLAGVTYGVADGLSNYNAFQLTVDKRMSKGLSLLVGYTWSHGIDNVGTEFGGGTGTPQDIRCRNCERSNSSFDMRHRLTLSYTYALPFFRDQKGLTRLALGGWQFNGITTMQTGLPYTPGLLTANTNGAGGSRPDSTGTSAALDNPTLGRWFDPAAFTSPATIRFGNAGRNILFGPGRVNFDVSMFKDFAWSDRFKVQFRTEAFNVFNTPQFGLPNASIGAPNAGTITSTVGNPRQLQLALRLQF